jgi:ABC-type bacteriocin/lantibiotic exporter with double-glycine peptidase domain
VSGIVIEKVGRRTSHQASASGNDSAVSLFSPDHNAAPLSLFAALRVLLGHLSKKRRKSLLPLLILMLAGAVAELVTIGALLPFLAVIADPASPVLAYIAPFLSIFGVAGRMQSIYALTALFAIAALIAAIVRLLLLWAGNSFVYGVAYELGVKLYADTLAQPYAYHIQRNTSEIIASINKVQLIAGEVLAPLMYAVVATVISAFIIAGLVMIDPLVALISGLGFAVIYLAASVTCRPRLRRNSAVIAHAQGWRVQAMQEGLGGIRDILIDRSQPVFTDTYERAEAGLRDARTKNVLFATAPRFIVEGAGMVLIALVAVMVTSRPGGLAQAVPVLGALALGAQRLLPLAQQIYAGWAQASGNRQNLADVVALLERPAPHQAEAGAPLPFEKSLVLDHVGYAYGRGRAHVLSGINLEIPKGARVGIAGKTGSGKSTLTDLVIGLLEPSAGEIRVDGVRLSAVNRAAWQKNIAHVPQSIFLADASVLENIAFGVKRQEIDRERARRAAEQAELAEVIDALPQGYDTRVGERGIQLSGGQRQRIGIARALYKQANVLVFDEATSALDTETESAVMAAIERLDRSLTILIIAHRLSTLEGCDMVVRLEERNKKEPAYRDL